MQSKTPLIQIAQTLTGFHARRKQVEKETQERERMTATLARFLNPTEGLA
jgi:hypothetical protein